MMDIMVGFGSGDDEKYRNKKKSSCYILEEERTYGKYIFNPGWSRAARIKIDEWTFLILANGILNHMCSGIIYLVP